MKTTVDARGLACPQPVLLAKKAIAENEEVTVLVDNEIAVENIRRLAAKTACCFSVMEREGGVWEIAMETQQFIIFLFPSVSYTLKAEKIIKEKGIAYKLIPVPRHISSDCGVCLRVAADRRDAAESALQGRVNWEGMVFL